MLSDTDFIGATKNLLVQHLLAKPSSQIDLICYNPKIIDIFTQVLRRVRYRLINSNTDPIKNGIMTAILIY